MSMNRKIESRGWWAVALCVLLIGAAVSPAAPATNRYVVKNNPAAAPPYNTPANAAPDIQTAVNVAVAANGDQVLVAAGVYDNGGATAPTYALTNRVMVNKAVVVRSLDNDPATTIIEGARNPTTTNGPAAVRGAYLATGAKLIGFTVRNSATASTAVNQDIWGGGVYCTGTGATISNCVIVGNVAHAYGGGVYSGKIYDSLIVSNRSTGSYGGGARGSVLNGCAITHNRAYNYGGGGSSITATNCVFAYNRANGGGAVAEGSLYGCLMYGNLADSQGGGAVWDAVNLYNCTIVGNQLNGNAAGIGGGGIYVRSTRTVIAINCIVYFNQATRGPNIYVNPPGVLYITNTCTYPDISGWAAGNITNNPLFMAVGSGFGTNHVAGNYHLRTGSPCVDKGTNMTWMSGVFDLDGIARVRDGRVDIGCYEAFFKRGTAVFIR